MSTASKQLATSGTEPVDTPLPLGQFKRFLVIFHAVFASGLLLILALRWNRDNFAWGWRDTLLINLVVLQLLLYARFFVFPREQTHQTRWFLAYFATAYTIWLIEWRIEPGLEWVVWAYMGQMFGTLPPRVTVPASLGIFAVYFGTKFGWSRLGSVGVSEFMGAGAVVLGVTSAGLFLYRLVVTSSERARLIEQLRKAQKELEDARERVEGIGGALTLSANEPSGTAIEARIPLIAPAL